MTHRVAPEVEAEIDNIWYYVAKEIGRIPSEKSSD